MFGQYWASVVDGGPTLIRHWVHGSFLLGTHYTPPSTKHPSPSIAWLSGRSLGVYGCRTGPSACSHSAMLYLPARWTLCQSSSQTGLVCLVTNFKHDPSLDCPEKHETMQRIGLVLGRQQSMVSSYCLSVCLFVAPTYHGLVLRSSHSLETGNFTLSKHKAPRLYCRYTMES